jgi:hypothetical protein
MMAGNVKTPSLTDECRELESESGSEFTTHSRSGTSVVRLCPQGSREAHPHQRLSITFLLAEISPT